MEKEIIDFNTSKLSKEKGFNCETLYFYTKPNIEILGIDYHGDYYETVNIPKKLYNINKYAVLDENSVYLAPTKLFLQKWLMEKNILVTVCYYPNYKKYITKIYKNNSEIINLNFDEYEKALDTGLYEGLKLI